MNKFLFGGIGILGIVLAGVGTAAAYHGLQREGRVSTERFESENVATEKEMIQAQKLSPDASVTQEVESEHATESKRVGERAREDVDDDDGEDEGESEHGSNAVPAVASVQTKTVPPTQTPSTFTMVQVRVHNTATNCYTAINGSVYNVTSWISQHPGGAQAILSLCGTDGSAAFDGQHGGQGRPESELASFKIGTLVQ